MRVRVTDRIPVNPTVHTQRWRRCFETAEVEPLSASALEEADARAGWPATPNPETTDKEETV